MKILILITLIAIQLTQNSHQALATTEDSGKKRKATEELKEESLKKASQKAAAKVMSHRVLLMIIQEMPLIEMNEKEKNKAIEIIKNILYKELLLRELDSNEDNFDDLKAKLYDAREHIDSYDISRVISIAIQNGYNNAVELILKALYDPIKTHTYYHAPLPEPTSYARKRVYHNRPMMTPLTIAILKNNKEIVNLLIKYGHDEFHKNSIEQSYHYSFKNETTETDLSPLYLAAYLKNHEIIQLLNAEGIQLAKAFNEDNNVLLERAIRDCLNEKDLETLKILSNYTKDKYNEVQVFFS
jgi:hypothetical protein